MKARYVNVYKLMEFANNMKDKTIDANDIARFPWADVRENVHRRWIFKNDNIAIPTGYYECPLCGCKLMNKENFCPHCGVVMDEEEENEETN